MGMRIEALEKPATYHVKFNNFTDTARGIALEKTTQGALVKGMMLTSVNGEDTAHLTCDDVKNRLKNRPCHVRFERPEQQVIADTNVEPQLVSTGEISKWTVGQWYSSGAIRGYIQQIISTPPGKTSGRGKMQIIQTPPPPAQAEQPIFQHFDKTAEGGGGGAGCEGNAVERYDAQVCERRRPRWSVVQTSRAQVEDREAVQHVLCLAG